MLNADRIALLQFYAAIGADEALEDETHDRMRLPEKSAAVLPLAAEKPVAPESDAVKEAEAAAQGARTIEELKAALENFKDLPLKRTAPQMVFSDGVPGAKVMIVGDMPAAEDERAGVPFSGEAGQMLDKMIAAIGLSRAETVYLSCLVNWRPPKGRAPTPAEIALSLPFAKRHIALAAPDVLVLVGGAAAQMLLGTKEPTARLRGKWLAYEGLPALVLYHPAYLMQNPAEKRPAWEDLQMLQTRLKKEATP